MVAPAQSETPDPPILATLGVLRLAIPVPFMAAGGPVNVLLIDNPDGSLTLFDSGLGTAEAIAVLRQGFERAGRKIAQVRDVIVSHGHIDHYGAAHLFVEEAGARVWIHPADETKVLRGRWLDRDPGRYAAYLARLGLDPDFIEPLKKMVGSTGKYARPLEAVSHLSHGQKFAFAKFEGEILHMPGHTPGLVCLHDPAHKVLFADDHLLARVSPNPLIELGPKGEEDKFRALSAYFESAAKVRAMDLDWVVPGHGPPFQGHRKLIDSLMEFYRKRQEKLLAALEGGEKTALELLFTLFPRTNVQELYLMLSEVVGNLEVLEDQGRVRRSMEKDVYRFARTT